MGVPRRIYIISILFQALVDLVYLVSTFLREPNMETFRIMDFPSLHQSQHETIVIKHCYESVS